MLANENIIKDNTNLNQHCDVKLSFRNRRIVSD